MDALKYIYICVLLLTSLSISAMQGDVVVKSYSNLNESYIELYTYIINPLKNQDSIISKNLESLVVISNDENIVVAEKYIYQVDKEQQTDILDFKRFNIGNGRYTIRVEIIDLDDASNYFSHSEQITLDFQENQFAHSDILVGFQSESENEVLKKMNVSVEPMVFDFCRNQENLVLYNEFYNTDSYEEALFAGYSIRMSGEDTDVLKKKFSKIAPESFVPILTVIPIDDLLSGAYVLKLEVLNRAKEVIHEQELTFNVSNATYDLKHEISYNKNFENSWVQKMTEEELHYGIKSIFPQLTNRETDVFNYVLDQKDLTVKRYFLYKFWADRSSEFPEDVYDGYMKVAVAVDNTFKSNLGYGFETDRGYIFLKYGKPNDVISVEDEPTAPPYEIWVYNYVPETKQTNIKFLFYNQSLAANDFKLLHSNCRGELNNPRWEVVLYGDDPNVAEQNPIDARKVSDGYNRRAREYFSDF